MSMPRVGILISGSGSNMVALVEAMQDGRVGANPVIVLSNDPSAGGLGKAQALGVEAKAIDHRSFGGDRAAFDAALHREMSHARCDLIACAGFMRIMTEGFVAHWAGRMLNIHPSLLPLFKGLETHRRALDAGASVHGCTVHEVSAELDSGRILGQAAVPVLEGDTPESLAARVLEQEHRLYPQVLAAFVRDPEAARHNPITLPEGQGLGTNGPRRRRRR